MYSDSLASPRWRGINLENDLSREVKDGKGREGIQGLGSSDLQDM